MPALESLFVTVHRFWALAAFLLLCVVQGRSSSGADEVSPLRIEDLYATDTFVDAVSMADGCSTIYCRQRADADTRAVRQSLWRVDKQGGMRPLEAGEPDGFCPVLSPDQQWIGFLSVRAREDGMPPCRPVPPYSYRAADIWLIPAAGGRAIPLADSSKPYGRVIADTFYGRIAFSHDGQQLAFVADTGIDPRTESERHNNALIVRDGQGEGYEGYCATHIWVADLVLTQTDSAARRISQLTADNFWYGDPQWSPDGSYLVVHANRTPDQEPVGASMNRNFDLWKIAISDHQLTQLTTGPGPEIAPRISPDGKRIACLSSPRKGPHLDVFNLMILTLGDEGVESRLLFDHHAPSAGSPPHFPPTFPLPANCWRDCRRLTFNANCGPTSGVPQMVDIDAGAVVLEVPLSTTVQLPQLPLGDRGASQRLRGSDQIIRWKSFDALGIEGVLTLPPASIAQPPYKLLVWPHGGPHSRAVVPSTFDVQIFAMNGFAVFQPMYRGSAGYGLEFLEADRNDFGGGDAQDILTGIDHIIDQGIADRDRQFIFGTSYGGFLAAWLIGHTNQFRAAAIQNAVVDLTVAWHLSDVQSWSEWEMSGKPWDVPDRFREHSPLTYASKVRTPTLIQHSLHDLRVPVAMGKMFHRVLKTNGVAVELVVYPDEGHTIRQLPHREDVLRRTLDWFEKYGQVAGEGE